MVFALQGCPTGRQPCSAAGLRASSGVTRHPAHGRVDNPLALRQAGDLSVARVLRARARPGLHYQGNSSITIIHHSTVLRNWGVP